jgi:23S rRNA-/tRNA-specific pseudouridylate synthase
MYMKYQNRPENQKEIHGELSACAWEEGRTHQIRRDRAMSEELWWGRGD